ncbi:NosD domain-containing protein [Methanolobus profundi]|uniref:PGF-pre-PGF domain-containing protein n=1 Tax=Methanolobus profundi TaxID=487685 RepID=A0A1I4T6U4_9EURY|nr:NosD domain-containing protein [Methanolobus profundi]SFM72416.1 PGF-pre-PGF domain-containing protein [Methanolobus profundi]
MTAKFQHTLPFISILKKFFAPWNMASRFKNSVYTCLFVLSMIVLSISIASAGTLNVTTVAGPGNYTTIQAAVDNSSSGDTIFVYPDTYTENVIVNKSGINIISTEGASATNIVAPASGNVFYVADTYDVLIDGFNVSGPLPLKSIYLYNTSSSTVSNITAISGTYGIYLEEADNNTLADNDLQNNSDSGIRLNSADNNSITDNTAISNIRGFYISDSVSNTLSGNIANLSTQFGFHLKNTSSNTITDNKAYSNGFDGITLNTSTNSIIMDNEAGSNAHYGIYLDASSNNTVTGNTVNSNVEIGIWLDASHNCTVTGNTANLNPDYGIALEYADDNTLANNSAASNGVGFALGVSNTNTVTNNTAESNGYGFTLAYASNGNVLTENAANSSAVAGFLILSSGSNTLTGNTAHLNANGIRLISAASNLIYNNLFNNSINFVDGGGNSGNTWNTTLQVGTNIIGGTYLGGNYWATPTGTGFSEVNPDINGDGIADESYTLMTSNVDQLPLAVPSPILSLGNIANLSYDWGTFDLNHSVTVTNQTADNVTISYNVSWISDGNPGTITDGETKWLNQTVTNDTIQTISVLVHANNTNPAENDSAVFTIDITPRDIVMVSSPSSGTMGKGEDFWINASVTGEYSETFIGNADLISDGIVTDTIAVTDGNASFQHNRSATGTYTFAVRFYNTSHYYNTTSSSSVITIPGTTSGSSEDTGRTTYMGGSFRSENTTATDTSVTYVQNGSNRIVFDDPQGPVVSMEFTADRNIGFVAARVQILKNDTGKISEYPDRPQGPAISITIGTEETLSNANVDEIDIDLRVSQEWIDDNNVDPSTIRLATYRDEEWTDLSTEQSWESAGFVYFSTKADMLGTFRIVGDEVSEAPAYEEKEIIGEDNDIPSPEEQYDSNVLPVAVTILIVALLAGALFLLAKHRKDEEE